MAQTKKTAAPIEAVVRPLDLAQHQLEVELRIPAQATAKAGSLELPAWTPGSYLIRDYARLVDRVRLVRGAAEEPLSGKLDKQRWPLPASKEGLVVRYRVYGNELTVRTNHIDGTHAQVIPAATFMVPEGQKGRPWTVRFEGFPKGWNVATALGSTDGAHRAADFDELVDSPFEVGPFRLHAFDQDGVRFEMVLSGSHNGEEARMVEGSKAVVAQAGRIFGGFPFKRYVFFLTFSPRTGGGLEHKASTSLLSDPFRFEKADGYYGLFSLVAHEFFHVWNVKAMHDPVLGPFDYGQENYTRLLWFHEGFTSYMEHALVLRAGVVPWSHVSRALATEWTNQIQRPGWAEQSLEESSFDSWIRQYKPHEFTPNSTVGYYDKGEVVGWVMDATLRAATGGAKGLDDLFAHLWKTRGTQGVTDADVQAAFKTISGLDPKPFWEAFIRGRAPLDPKPIEQAFGLKLELKAPWELLSPEDLKDADAVARAKAFTGLLFAPAAPGAPEPPTVWNVLPGTPAAEAGISFGHEILSVNGWRTTSATDVRKRLADTGLGKSADVSFVDRGRVHTAKVKVMEDPRRSLRVLPHPLVTDTQKAAFQAWTGQPFPAPAPVTTKPLESKGK
ncbi:MAG TPA: PDZ domain-containing protein [Holophagaceae bacterium]|nr:PDZ domain-containing protein [Holophagaceae bacterium]